jgi:molybdenum cofactor cytidylyltransferase
MIAAIILAAGESKRMGQPKMLMRWGEVTVLEHVLSVFQKAGVEDLVIVLGAEREQIEKIVSQYPIRCVHNEDYTNSEMLSSLQCGLKAMTLQTQATLIGLGDQPQVQEGSVRLICEAHHNTRSELIVPSFQMRRGHPWLVGRTLWGELLNMKAPKSPRDFLNRHTDRIHYVDAKTATILADLDTPDDYYSSHS